MGGREDPLRSGLGNVLASGVHFAHAHGKNSWWKAGTVAKTYAAQATPPITAAVAGGFRNAEFRPMTRMAAAGVRAPIVKAAACIGLRNLAIQEQLEGTR